MIEKDLRYRFPYNDESKLQVTNVLCSVLTFLNLFLTVW